MIPQSIILTVAAVLISVPAWAQGNTTLTENVNNTGIPRNAPSLGLANIYGLNPCSSGAAIGVTTPLFGVGGAIADIDKECEIRNNAAVVITGLKDEVMAREILCQIKDIRQAAIRVGKPCLEDSPAPRVSSAEPVKPVQPEAPLTAARPAQTPVTAATPALTEVAVATVKPNPPEVPAVPSHPATLAIRPDAPAFCRTKDLDLALYPDCTGAASASTVGPSGPVRAPSKIVQTPPARKPVNPPAAGNPVARIQRHPAPPSRLASCEEGGAARPGNGCHAGTETMIALERNLARLINDRRQELAAAEHPHDGSVHAAPTTSVAEGRVPQPHTTLLAAAVPADR